MNYEILTTIVCSLALGAWGILLVRLTIARLAVPIQNLDQSLVEVVEQIAQGIPGLGDQEPINPFQALIMQFIQGKIENMPQDVPASVQVLDRDGEGKFSPKTE